MGDSEPPTRTPAGSHLNDPFEDSPFSDLAGLLYDLARVDETPEQWAQLRDLHMILPSSHLSDDVLHAATDLVRTLAHALGNDLSAPQLVARLREVTTDFYNDRCLFIERLRRASHIVARHDEQERADEDTLRWLEAEIENWGRIKPPLAKLDPQFVLENLRTTAEQGKYAERGFPGLGALCSTKVRAWGDKDFKRARSAFRRSVNRSKSKRESS